MDWIEVSPASFTAIFETLFKLFSVMCLIMGNIKIIQIGIRKIGESSSSAPPQSSGGDFIDLRDAMVYWMIQPLYFAFNTDFGFTANPLRIFMTESTNGLSFAGQMFWYVFASLTFATLVIFSTAMFGEESSKAGLIKKGMMVAVTLIVCQIFASIFDALT